MLQTERDACISRGSSFGVVLLPHIHIVHFKVLVCFYKLISIFTEVSSSPINDNRRTDLFA